MGEAEEKNATALRAALADMDQRIRAQQIQINGFQRAIGTLQERVALLEREASLARAMMMGRGPTAR